MNAKTQALVLLAEAIAEAETKGDIAAPISTMSEVLNDMYKDGVMAMKAGDTRLMVFNHVDVDLFVINLAINSILLKSWHDASSFDEMKATMSEKILLLKADIDKQLEAGNHKKQEMQA